MGWNTLPDVTPDPVYDDNFLTVWSNLPVHIYNGTNTYRLPRAGDTNTAVRYSSYTNDLDGFSYAMTSVFDTVNLEWNPSLFKPILFTRSNAYITNRLSYYGSATPILDNVYTHIQVATQRAETNVVNQYITGIEMTVQPAGAIACELVNISTLTETTYKAMNWMLSIDTIGRVDDKRSYGKPVVNLAGQGGKKSDTFKKGRKRSKPKFGSKSRKPKEKDSSSDMSIE